MARFVITVIITLLLLHVVAALCPLGYGAATGRFDQQDRAQYWATWTGQELVPPTDTELVEEVPEGPQQASDRIAQSEKEREVGTTELQRHNERLRSIKTTLDAVQASLEARRKELNANIERFQRAQAEQAQLARDAGFQKTLSVFTQMKPKYVKDDFMQMDDTDVVRYISAMKADTAKSILEQFKTVEEQRKRQSVMKLLQSSAVVSSSS